MTYFIEAADEIIRQEGIEAVTIRKAADKAGYTSATLYNYFENLTHLVFLAALNHLEEYYAALPKYLAGSTNSVERYLAIAQCFTEFSLAKPDIYELLFFTQADEKLEEYMQQYYELFPEKMIKNSPIPLPKIFHVNNMTMRNALQLEDIVEEGYFTKEDAGDFNEVSLMISKCILQDVQNGRVSRQEGIEKVMKFYRQILSSYMTKGCTANLDNGVPPPPNGAKI
jgi:AcrR family transcriptional regulator